MTRTNSFRALGVIGALAVCLAATGVGAASAAPKMQESHKPSGVSNVAPIPQQTYVSFKNSSNKPVTVVTNSYIKNNVRVATTSRVLGPGQQVAMGAGMNEQWGSDDVNGTITYSDGSEVFYRAASPWGFMRSPWAGFGHGDNWQRFGNAAGQATQFSENGKNFTVSVLSGGALGISFLIEVK